MSPTTMELMNVPTGEYYRSLDRWLRGFKHMSLTRWKLAQNALISILVTYLALETSADPTIAIAVIALINGISLADLAALWNVSANSGDGPPVTVERENTQNESAERDAPDN